MDVPLRVEVFCSDGACGRSTVIVVDPATQQVTHFVVENAENAYLVPIDAIADSSNSRITLRWNREELSHAESFVSEAPADEQQLEMMAAAMTGSSVLGPYSSPDSAYISEALAQATVMHEQVPESELAIHEDARVEATDGDVGRVDELIIVPGTNRISHLVIRRGRLWSKHDISIPLDQIDRVEGDTVYLKLDKKGVEHLPAAPAPKK